MRANDEPCDDEDDNSNICFRFSSHYMCRSCQFPSSKRNEEWLFHFDIFLVAPVDLELKMIHFKRSGKVRQKESEMIGSKMK